MPRELGQESGQYEHEEYKHRMDKVVWSIKQMVERLGDNSPANIEQTIYLAEATRDRRDDRDRIRAELEARKFIVLPERPLLTDDVQEYMTSVRDHLKRSFMSIHLMGRTYGTILDDEARSLIHLQNDLAAEHSKNHKQFKRLIWIPPDLEKPDNNQSNFLTDLRINEEAQRGAELYEKSFEYLKTRIIQLITKSQDTPVWDNLVRIYLMCERSDVDSVGPVWRYLYDKGFEVIPPAEDDDAGQVMQYYRDNLLLCDATLIIYGNVKWNWVQSCINDISIKVRGWGREHDFLCKTNILRTAPETKYKSQLFIRAAKLLPPCYNELSAQTLEASLQEFINDLERALNTRN